MGDDAESEWIQSTTSNSQAFQFLPDGVIPIWQLIPNATQSKRVKEHYDQVFGAMSMILKRFESPALNSVGRVPHPEAQVYVPKGWKVISGGAKVQFYGPGQLLTRSYPIVEDRNPVGWMAQSKDHIKSDIGKIQAFAIGLWDPFDSWSVIVRQSTSSTTAHPSTTAYLPSNAGYERTGGGANALWKSAGSMLVASALTERSPMGWTAGSMDHIRSEPVRIKAYVIGMKRSAKENPFVRTRWVRFGPAQHPSGTTHATHGCSFVGGGAKVSRGGPGNFLVNAFPSSDGETFSCTAKDHLRTDFRYLTVYGIEAEGALYVNDIEDTLGFDPTVRFEPKVSVRNKS